MADPVPVEDDSSFQTLEIILAATNHNVPPLRAMLRNGSANVQDPETGFTPLHAAIAACEDSETEQTQVNGNHVNGISNGITESNGEPEQTEVEAAATKTLKLLLQNGAIWNLVDSRNETPGCLALRLGLKGLYEIMVDAGVRAEMLLNRMDEYEALAESEDEDEEHTTFQNQTSGIGEVEVGGELQRNVDECEIKPPSATEPTPNEGLHNEDYLQASLRFQDGRILDDSGNGVMMAWETDLMKLSADLLCPEAGLKVLNVGHGMGIIDSFFQAKSPATHHIIEAHPAVLERMKKDGWIDKPNVIIHEGRWQDIVPEILEEGILFDAIYFDTFAEDYKAFRDFFSDNLIGLLEDSGKWGFFHGLGADRQICYDVYTKVVEMDLFEAGFDTEWETLRIPDMSENDWVGVKRKYWALKEYKLPVCSFIG